MEKKCQCGLRHLDIFVCIHTHSDCVVFLCLHSVCVCVSTPQHHLLTDPSDSEEEMHMPLIHTYTHQEHETKIGERFETKRGTNMDRTEERDGMWGDRKDR